MLAMIGPSRGPSRTWRSLQLFCLAGILVLMAAVVLFAINNSHEPVPHPSGKTLLVEMYFPSNTCASANFSNILQNLSAVSIIFQLYILKLLLFIQIATNKENLVVVLSAICSDYLQYSFRNSPPADVVVVKFSANEPEEKFGNITKSFLKEMYGSIQDNFGSTVRIE